VTPNGTTSATSGSYYQRDHANSDVASQLPPGLVVTSFHLAPVEPVPEIGLGSAIIPAMSNIDRFSQQLLRSLCDDFRGKELGANALGKDYVGLSVAQMKSVLDPSLHVDFDLALKDLEQRGLISTGPMVPYQNEPGSAVFVFGVFSKREYAYLTEEGYKAAQAPSAGGKSGGAPKVTITGGHFHQSPIGIGREVTQTTTFHIEDDTEAVEGLLRLLESQGQLIDSITRKETQELVAHAGAGNLARAKPLFQKLFGLAGETLKQTAWGVLVGIVTKQMGI
jgi:hypothetical protein